MRLYPVTVRRTTIIQGGGGPNPSDAFSIRLTFPDTAGGQSDDINLRMVFPDTAGGQSDAASFRLTLPETAATATDSFTIRLGFAEAASGQTDDVSLKLMLPDTASGQTEGLSLRVNVSEQSAGQTDALPRVGMAHNESSPAQSDAFTLSGSATYSDTNTAPSEGLTALLRGLGDTTGAPTDGRSATATWEVGATTATQVGSWTTPANAQGLRDGTAVANLTDGALGAVDGTLTMDPYPDPDATFSSWAVTKVRWKVYADGNFSVATAARLNLEYSVDGTTWTTLEAIGVPFDNRATGEGGRLYDVTADRAWTWPNIGTARFRARYVPNLVTNTANLNIDAVHLEVTATKNPL